MSSEVRKGTIDAHEEALVDLVKLDYDATLRTITGVVATGAAIRAAGFAAWGALLGFGVRDGAWSLSALGAVIAVLFAYADAHHAELYRRTPRRAVALERLLDRYADRLGIDAEDEDAVLATVAELEAHRFGVYRTLPRLRRRDLWKARPVPVFRVLYPALFAMAVTAALISAL